MAGPTIGPTQLADSDSEPGVTERARRVYPVVLPPGAEQARDVQKVLDDWNYTVINGTGATVVRNVSTHGPVTYGGYKILGNAGAYTITVYDNTAASGQLLEPSAISVASAGEKVYTKGLRVANGICVNLSGDPTDGLILILWR